jgi:glucose-6-phosphate 1-epimerase
MALSMLSTRRVSVAGAKRAGRKSLIVRSSVADLQKKFGIDGSVEITEGRGSLPIVKLKHACGSTADVYLFGAVVGSWTQPTGDEVLYVRPDAVFDKSKPISGGVPHCFPQFGPSDKMQQHGFARNLDWTIASTSADFQPDEKDPEVELVLTENDYTMAMFPYKFKVAYTITLHGELLKTDFRVINTDDKPFDFTAALHTYFEVAGVDKAKVMGLKGLKYLDKSLDAKNPSEKTEDRDAVTFGTALVDSVYLDSGNHVELDVGTGAAVSIDSTGWTDTVVWNPHLTMKACYESFVCVENAKSSAPVVLQPGESWRATTSFGVINLA